MGILKEIKKRIFPTMVALSALSVSVSAAFYSVSGLSKLFAGATFEVIIMASSLEVAKLVIASLLYQYWGKINKLLRFYLTLSTIILVLITSAVSTDFYLPRTKRRQLSQESLIRKLKS